MEMKVTALDYFVEAMVGGKDWMVGGGGGLGRL